MKKIVFLTGTRADYGKLKPLINKLSYDKNYEVIMLVTGMHLHNLYGYTVKEIKKDFKSIKIIKCKNFNLGDSMDTMLSKSIKVFGKVLKKINPNLVVIHGDRLETLAVSVYCNFNNILIAHVEGGELSGTVDEAIRHANSKMAHIHFVSNLRAKKLLIRMGEFKKNIYVIGSPEVDIMLSKKLPKLEDCKKRYDIKFKDYAILTFHPVTTLPKKQIIKESKTLFSTIKETNENYIIIFPNNDTYSNIILKEILKIKSLKVKILPSIKFEYYLTLLKNSKFIIGNSSSGIREAPVYGIKSINLGKRQTERTHNKGIINIDINKSKILNSIKKINLNKKIKKTYEFGSGNSADKFFDIIKKKTFWLKDKQKRFVI